MSLFFDVRGNLRESFELMDETQDYILVIGKFDIESFEGRRVYGLINKKTQVLEAVGPSLSASLSALYSFQKDLNDVRAAIVEIKTNGYPEDQEDEFKGLLN